VSTPKPFHFVLIAFFGAPRCLRQSMAQMQIELDPGCTQWKISAQSRSRAAFPVSICQGLLQFCNRILADLTGICRSW
jgi:hypothetical protein